MKNRLKVLRLVCGLLLGLVASSRASALEDYSGPQEAAQHLYQIIGSGLAAGGCGANTQVSWAAVISCAHATGRTASNYEWVSGNSGNYTSLNGHFPLDTEPAWSNPAPLPAINAGSQLMLCPTSVGTTSCANPQVQLVATCSATNRALAFVAGAIPVCASTCFSLRSQFVSAFVPIDSPSQNVASACFFLPANGICEIEVVDASNYTYGSQLYRQGTWAYTGQRCTEDASDAPTTGAVTQAPTGGTGSGSGDSGLTGSQAADLNQTKVNTGATKTAIDGLAGDLSAIRGKQCGGTGQPVCAVTSDEGSTATSRTDTDSNIADSRAGMESQLQARADGISTSAAPSFGGDGRWLFSMSGYLPASSCTFSSTMHVLGNDMPVEFSVCAWGGYVQDLFFWVLSIMTTLGVWMILFRS